MVWTILKDVNVNLIESRWDSFFEQQGLWNLGTKIFNIIIFLFGLPTGGSLFLITIYDLYFSLITCS